MCVCVCVCVCLCVCVANVMQIVGLCTNYSSSSSSSSSSSINRAFFSFLYCCWDVCDSLNPVTVRVCSKGFMIYSWIIGSHLARTMFIFFKQLRSCSSSEVIFTWFLSLSYILLTSQPPTSTNPPTHARTHHFAYILPDNCTTNSQAENMRHRDTGWLINWWILYLSPSLFHLLMVELI